jgi:peptide/nickel transport system substrate-binding protein
MVQVKVLRTPIRRDSLLFGSAILILIPIFAANCGRSRASTRARDPVTLRVGFGLTAGTVPQMGIQQTARNLGLERLVRVQRNGRVAPWVVENWTVSADGLLWRIYLRPSARFHDGRPADAEIVRSVLAKELPQSMGPAFDDIDAVRAIDSTTIEFTLKRPSSFLLEGLDILLQEPGGKGSTFVGTGPFQVVSSSSSQAEMTAYEQYYHGPPAIDRVVIKPYTSVRAAWADLLRGEVDMLYDVGVEALDSLEASRQVRIFPFQRGYALLVLLNVEKPYLRDLKIRRALNAAINRDELVSDALRGHGSVADGPVWPGHWAYSSELPRFEYQPRPAFKPPLGFKCLLVESAHEPFALAVQRQLQAIGVDLGLEFVTGDQYLSRLRSGDFDMILIDAGQGPNLARPYLFWHSDSPYNWGHYKNRKVDEALDSIRHAVDDEAYKAGVAAFQRAIIDDPPAIFLAWRERARAVSTRFHVPAEPGTDILSSLRLWRPANEERLASRN